MLSTIIVYMNDVYKSDADVRQMFKAEIDVLPEPVFAAVREFTIREKERFYADTTDQRPDAETRRAAFKRLSKYFGTVEREISAKQELIEALDDLGI